MKDNLIIGTIKKPYSGEDIYTRKMLSSRDKCNFINIGRSGYSRLLFKLAYYLPQSKNVTYITKAYTRPSLLFLFLSGLMSKALLKRFEVVLYPELFNFFGQFRSKLVGEFLLHSIFSLADKIIYSSETTKKAVQYYYKDVSKMRYESFFLEKEESNQELKNFVSRYESIIVVNEIREKEIMKLKNGKKQGIVYLGKNLDLKNKKDLLVLPEYSIEDVAFLYYSGAKVVRNLKCDGKLIVPGESFIVERIRNKVVEGNVFIPKSKEDLLRVISELK